MTIQTVFKEDEFCLRELGQAWLTMLDRRTTQAAFEAMEKVLTLMFLHCSDRVRELVLATMDEARMRKVHFIARVWPLAMRAA